MVVLSIVKIQLISQQFSQSLDEMINWKSSTPRPVAKSRQSPGQTIVWTLNNKDNLHSFSEIIKSSHMYYFLFIFPVNSQFHRNPSCYHVWRSSLGFLNQVSGMCEFGSSRKYQNGIKHARIFLREMPVLEKMGEGARMGWASHYEWCLSNSKWRREGGSVGWKHPRLLWSLRLGKDPEFLRQSELSENPISPRKGPITSMPAVISVPQLGTLVNNASCNWTS